MLTLNTAFEAELRKLIAEQIERLATNLCGGLSVQDIADYRNQVGQIQGLRKTLEMCEDVQTILAKR